MLAGLTFALAAGFTPRARQSVDWDAALPLPCRRPRSGPDPRAGGGRSASKT